MVSMEHASDGFTWVGVAEESLCERLPSHFTWVSDPENASDQWVICCEGNVYGATAHEDEHDRSFTGAGDGPYEIHLFAGQQEADPIVVFGFFCEVESSNHNDYVCKFGGGHGFLESILGLTGHVDAPGSGRCSRNIRPDAVQERDRVAGNACEQLEQTLCLHQDAENSLDEANCEASSTCVIAAVDARIVGRRAY